MLFFSHKPIGSQVAEKSAIIEKEELFYDAHKYLSAFSNVFWEAGPYDARKYSSVSVTHLEE
jgi:hypothetical protein